MKYCGHTPSGCSSEAALCLQLNNYQQKFLELAQTDTQVISSVGQGKQTPLVYWDPASNVGIGTF